MAGPQAPPSASPKVARIACPIPPSNGVTVAWRDARSYAPPHAGLGARKRIRLRAEVRARSVGYAHTGVHVPVSTSGHARSAAPVHSCAGVQMRACVRAGVQQCAYAGSHGCAHAQPHQLMRADEPAGLLAHTSACQHPYIRGLIHLHLIAGVLGRECAPGGQCVLSSATTGGHTRSRAPVGVSLPPSLQARMPRSARARADAHTDRWTADRPLVTSANHRST